MSGLKDEFRERVEDGELIRIKAEDRAAADQLAAQLLQGLIGQPQLQAFLAVEILVTDIVQEIAGEEWARAIKDVFKHIPVED